MSDETGVPNGFTQVEIGQGMENLPPDAGMPQYSGLVDATVASIAADATSGSLRFVDLPRSGEPFVGADWPAAVSGTLEWSCDPIPAEPTLPPLGASGAAKLAGAVSGIFGIRGDECPTPEHPDGFLSGTGTMDTGEAILEVTVRPDLSVSFVLYPTPGDKNDFIAATGPASLQVAGDGWAVALQEAPTRIGPVTLAAEWSCGG